MEKAQNIKLLGDIGGTNSRFAVFDTTTGDGIEVFRRRNADFASFPDVLQDILGDIDAALLGQIATCTLAVAGQVDGGQAHLTNLPEFRFDAAALSKQIGNCSGHPVTVHLLNDFEALAHILPYLKPEDLHPLKLGTADPDGPFLVIGPGTGLGLGILIQDANGTYRTISCEGGHLSLPIRDADDLRVRNQLVASAKGRFVDAEYALAGQGLSRLFAALASSSNRMTSEEVVRVALSGGNETAVQACNLAAEQALLFRPRGGVFLAGGVTLALQPFLQRSDIISEFYVDSRLSRDLAAMPLSVVTNVDTALIGAAKVF